MPDQVSSLILAQLARGPAPGKEAWPHLVPAPWVQGRGLGLGMETVPAKVWRETSKGMGGGTTTKLELRFSLRLGASHTELPQQTPSKQT